MPTELLFQRDLMGASNLSALRQCWKGGCVVTDSEPLAIAAFVLLLAPLELSAVLHRTERPRWRLD